MTSDASELHHCSHILAAAFPKHNMFASFVDTKLGPASGSLWELFPLSRGFSLRSLRVQVLSPFPFLPWEPPERSHVQQLPSVCFQHILY